MNLYPPEMVSYWEEIIRNERDDYRILVTNPALFGLLDEIISGSLVLDIGCGEGYVSRYLSANGHSVIGGDISDSFAKSAHDYSINGTGSANELYMQSDIHSLPFSDGALDAVVANQVFMELDNPSDAINEVSRILKPGGKFIFQMLHPARAVVRNEVENYYEHSSSTRTYVVDGFESPLISLRNHYPLSFYTQALKENRFFIYDLDEPTPIDSVPVDHPIQQKFKAPNILLVGAEKYR